MAETSYRNPNTRARGVAALLVQTLVSLGVGYWVFTQTFRVAGCGASCNFMLAEGAWRTQIWVSIVVFVASIVAVFWGGRKGRESWWMVAAGIVVIVATGSLTTIAIVVATAT